MGQMIRGYTSVGTPGTWNGNAGGHFGDTPLTYHPDQMASDPDQAAALKEQQRQFNANLDWKKSAWGDLFSRFSSGNPYTIGGGPQIDVGPVYNPQQIQQQVNASRAQGDQQVQTQQRQMQNSLGARGFGSNSPLAQALGGMYQGQNLAAQTANERQTRMNASQANTQQIFQSQVAREQALQERAKPFFAQQNALLSALAGLA